MVDREFLEQLSESELDKLYEEKKSEYDKRSIKYKRIQDLLRRKVTTRQKTIQKYQSEVDLLRVKHPDINVAKQDFDDNPQFLRESIQKHTTALLNLQTHQIQLKKLIKENNMELVKLQAQGKFLQKEVDELITVNEELSQGLEDQSEKMQLAVITSEYQTTHDLLDTITLEIEHLHKRLHDRS
ncbi:MAG: hypothetical protein ACW98F_13050 [Candidatus Hodarchaeales archaeon]|jgi:chromosome segregation ATPase